jgi:DNA-binding Lrp family transcriptional regulator
MIGQLVEELCVAKPAQGRCALRQCIPPDSAAAATSLRTTGLAPASGPPGGPGHPASDSMVTLPTPTISQGWSVRVRRRGQTPEGNPAMLSAFVLIQTEVGTAARVARAVGDLDGVERAEDVTGPYDVIARVQARGLDQLGRLVVARIQAVDGVTRTLTCPVVRL